MNILLATYSFYPYHYGGTEVYVAGLANHLVNQGHKVTVIAGMPPEAFEEHPVFYEDEQLKTVRYLYEGISVIGVILKDETTTEIYKKFRSAWSNSWSAVLNKLNNDTFDILHLHANTSPVGKSLIDAVKKASPNVKCIATYHLPISCGKGTLLYGNTLKECTIKPKVAACTACVLATKLQWPLVVTKPLAFALPMFANDTLPTAVRTKYLLKEFIQSFHALNNCIKEWQVFSTQIKQTLLSNGVEAKKINLLSHGVHPSFILTNTKTVEERAATKQIIFLYAGRFDKVKGFFTLLKAWQSISPSENRKLIIAGQNQTGDKEVRQLIQQISTRNDIVFKGALSQYDLAVLMNEVHCTIIPSEWIEIGPLVYHEAIAAGSDIIASNIGGCKSLAEKYYQKSTLFNAGDSTSLKKAIEAFKYSEVSLKTTTQVQNYEAVEQSYNQLSPATNTATNL